MTKTITSMSHQVRRAAAGVAGFFPGTVEGDLDLVELLQAGEGTQLGALKWGNQPQLPILILFDLQFLKRFCIHGVLSPSVNLIIEIILPGRFKKFVRCDLAFDREIQPLISR